MRPYLLSVMLAAATLAVAAAQTPSSTPQQPSKSKSLTLTGCVAPETGTSGRFTVADPNRGTYRVTGFDVKAFEGHRVRVIGKLVKNLHIVGGLYPSPNVAAQAGAIDPSRAATESAQRGGAASGTAPIGEIRVTSVRSVSGGCEPAK